MWVAMFSACLIDSSQVRDGYAQLLRSRQQYVEPEKLELRAKSTEQTSALLL